jgi:hypothetical protein
MQYLTENSNADQIDKFLAEVSNKIENIWPTHLDTYLHDAGEVEEIVSLLMEGEMTTNDTGRLETDYVLVKLIVSAEKKENLRKEINYLHRKIEKLEKTYTQTPIASRKYLDGSYLTI